LPLPPRGEASLAPTITTVVDAFSSATEMLRALQMRQISPSELVELHLERIARFNPDLNAIVTDNGEDARARAREERSGALGGLPVTIKDSIDLAGLPTTSGDPARRNAIAEADSPLAARVRAAGALVLGKTNVPLLTGDWQTNNAVFGRTLNPWDRTRTPGGSTGGGAAAVAAGLSPLEFGSDIGGSIRVPAAFCGIFGHKPSEGLVPPIGHFPTATVMAVLGPLARSAADLQLGLDVIKERQLPPARAKSLRELRVAVLPWLNWLPVDVEIQAAVEELARCLPRCRTAQPAGYVAWAQEELFASMLAAVTFGEVGEAREGIAGSISKAPEPLGPAILRGLRAGPAEFDQLLAEREQARARWQAFFQDFDVLLTPVTLVNAFPHQDGPFLRRTIEVNGEPQPYKRLEVYPGLAALTGLPATAIPAGLSEDGLPIGIQAVGPLFEDLTPLTFAALVEEELGYTFQPPPTYSGVTSIA